jgi:hypothetical protein
LSPPIDRTRTLRGAVCGAVAAAVWAIQQPLDKVAFGSRFDDVELLGKAVTRGPRWRHANERRETLARFDEPRRQAARDEAPSAP